MSRKRTSLDAIVNRSVIETQAEEPPASTARQARPRRATGRASSNRRPISRSPFTSSSAAWPSRNGPRCTTISSKDSIWCSGSAACLASRS